MPHRSEVNDLICSYIKTNEVSELNIFFNIVSSLKFYLLYY
jgi:hypothetical protein